MAAGRLGPFELFLAGAGAACRGVADLFGARARARGRAGAGADCAAGTCGGAVNTFDSISCVRGRNF